MMADPELHFEFQQDRFDDGDEQGVCMNCGGEMDFSPMHPWCPDCDFAEEADE